MLHKNSSELKRTELLIILNELLEAQSSCVCVDLRSGTTDNVPAFSKLSH